MNRDISDDDLIAAARGTLVDPTTAGYFDAVLRSIAPERRALACHALLAYPRSETTPAWLLLALMSDLLGAAQGAAITLRRDAHTFGKSVVDAAQRVPNATAEAAVAAVRAEKAATTVTTALDAANAAFSTSTGRILDAAVTGAKASIERRRTVDVRVWMAALCAAALIAGLAFDSGQGKGYAAGRVDGRNETDRAVARYLRTMQGEARRRHQRGVADFIGFYVRLLPS